MDALIKPACFIDFGPDDLAPRTVSSTDRIESGDRKTLKALVRARVPKCPGVYGMIDCNGRLIYVGKSKCLRNRLISYFLPDNEVDKSGQILQSTRTILWEQLPSEFSALLREQCLIRRFQPQFNVQGVPRRQRSVYICLGRAPAEQFYTSRHFDKQAIGCVGPFSGATRATRAVEVLNRLYRLRDCPNSQQCTFADQMQLFAIEQRPGCIRVETGSCLGPCVSACSRKEYAQQVALAHEFLARQDEWPLQHLQQRLNRAIARLQFERANIIHEDLQVLRWLRRKLLDLERARREYTFVYQVDPQREPYPLADAPVLWYLIRQGCVEGCIEKPRNAREQRIWANRLVHWLAGGDGAELPTRPRPETLSLVASWFRNRKSELSFTMAEDQIVRAA